MSEILYLLCQWLFRWEDPLPGPALSLDQNFLLGAQNLQCGGLQCGAQNLAGLRETSVDSSAGRLEQRSVLSPGRLCWLCTQVL